MTEGSDTDAVKLCSADSTKETVVTVGPPPYDDTTDISEGVSCYKCGKYVAKTWTQLWAHLRLRCLTEVEFNLAKTSWLHMAHRMEERHKEVARRRPIANAVGLMSESETPPAAQCDMPVAMPQNEPSTPASAQRPSDTPVEESHLHGSVMAAPSSRSFFTHQVVSPSTTIITTAANTHWTRAEVSDLLARLHFRATGFFRFFEMKGCEPQNSHTVTLYPGVGTLHDERLLIGTTDLLADRTLC